MTRETAATRSITQVRVDGPGGVASLAWWPRRGRDTIDPGEPGASLMLELAPAAAFAREDELA
jgi:hypothetical protein